MPSNSTITIKDGKATPADHVFSPMRIDANNVATFNERSGDTLIGQPQLSWQVRSPVNGNGETFKVAAKLSIPKVITTTDSTGKAVTSVDYVQLGTVELVVSRRSTLQERKDLRVLLANALLNATLASSADNVESFW